MCYTNNHFLKKKSEDSSLHFTEEETEAQKGFEDPNWLRITEQ